MNNGWTPLEPGEPIGVVALSGPVDEGKLEAGLEVLRGWGHPIVEASNVRREEYYLAGRDEERVAGVGEVLDGGARWIMAARGGYGSARILDTMPWERLRSCAARFIGFSDLTAILNPLACDGGVVQIHGPMVAAGLTGRHNADRLHALLRGELVGEVLFRFPQRSVVRAGRAEGRAVGGQSESPHLAPRYPVGAGLRWRYSLPRRHRRTPLPARPHVDPPQELW